MANRDTRIVSLTITEGGYNFDRVTGQFDAAHPAVAADLAPGCVAVDGVRVRHGGAPQTP